jgi:sporulation protein YlmC with PRC-barrel domain
MSETNEIGFVRLKDSDLMLSHAEDDVRGMTVVDHEGEPVGDVDEIIIDEQERRARLLVVTSGGFLGMGETKRLVPVEAVSQIDDEVHIQRSRQEVHDTPEYDPQLEEWPKYEDVYSSYGYAPFWGPGYRSPYFLRGR